MDFSVFMVWVELLLGGRLRSALFYFHTPPVLLSHHTRIHILSFVFSTYCQYIQRIGSYVSCIVLVKGIARSRSHTVWFLKKNLIYWRGKSGMEMLHSKQRETPFCCRFSFSVPTPITLCFPSYPETEMSARSWWAARAMEHPLDRVWCIWARRDGQSAEISPTEITCSRYSATRVLNSWTVCRETQQQPSTACQALESSSPQ